MMKTVTHIAGATCVVFKNNEHYLEARKDARRPHLTFIEIVRCGQVYLREAVDNVFAPERIAYYMREELK